MKKRIISLILVMAFAVSSVLSGCTPEALSAVGDLASRVSEAAESGLSELEEKIDSAVEQFSVEEEESAAPAESAGEMTEEESAEAEESAVPEETVVETGAEALQETEIEETTGEASAETERVTLSHGDSWKTNDTPETEASEETETSGTGENDTSETEEAEEETAPGSDQTAAFREFTDSLLPGMFDGDTFDVHFNFCHPEEFGLDFEELGFPKFAYDEESSTSYENYLTETLEELERFDYDSLDRDGQITYDLIRVNFENELSTVDLDYYYEPLCGTSGYQSSMPVILAEFKFYTEQDIDDYISYLNMMPEHYEDLLLYEQQKADHDMFMEDALAEQVIEQIDSFIETEDDENNFLYSSFAKRLEAFDLTKDQKEDYITRNAEAVPKVYEAYRTLRDGMEELLGSNVYEGGLLNYPQGMEYYGYLLKSDVGTSKTPAELVDYLDEKIDEEFNLLSLCFSSDQRIYDEWDALEPPAGDPEEMMKILTSYTDEQFPAQDDLRYEINYVDESLREFLNPAFYLIPAYGSDAVDEIYINPDEDGSLPEDIWTTLAHEGCPGHMYMYNYWNDINTFPIRTLFDVTGYAEGWAQYAGHLSSRYYVGISKNLADFISANDRLTTDIYGRMDLGIHYEGWDREELKDYIEQYFGALEDDVIDEVYYYLLANPAVYLEYAVGENEFLDIIDDYTEENDTDMKTFYEEFLSIGPAPFDIVRKYLGLN